MAASLPIGSSRPRWLDLQPNWLYSQSSLAQVLLPCLTCHFGRHFRQLGAQSHYVRQQLSHVVRGTHPQPFGAHLLQAAQQKPPHAQDTLNDGKRRLRNVHALVVDGLALGCLHLRSHLFPQWLVLVPLNGPTAFGLRVKALARQHTTRTVRTTVHPPTHHHPAPLVLARLFVIQAAAHRTIIRVTFLVVHKTRLGQLLLVVARQFRPVLLGHRLSRVGTFRRVALFGRLRWHGSVEVHAAQFHARQVEARPVCRVRQHFRGLSAEVFFDPIDGGQRLGLFVGRGDHVAIHNHSVGRVSGRQRRVIRGVTAFLVGHHAAVRIGLGNLRRVLCRIDPVLPPRLVRGLGLRQQFSQLLAPGLGSSQLRGKRRRLLCPVVCRRSVRLLGLRHPLFKQGVQFFQGGFQAFRGPGVQTAGIGLHPRPVEGHLDQPDQPHLQRQFPQLPKQVFQGPAKPRAELAEGRVVDDPSLRQPHEIHVVPAKVLQHPAGADAAHQAVEDHAGHDPRWDRRLTLLPIVLRLPRRPIQPVEHLVQQTNRMVVANRVVQGRREENDLIPRHPWFRPILHGPSPSQNNRRSLAVIASVNYNQPTTKHKPPIRVARSMIKSTDRLPGGADFAWVSAICHQHSRRHNRGLFVKVWRALVPGGRIIIRDIVMSPGRTQPLDGTLFAINMLVNTDSGGTFMFEEYSEDLKASGFENPRLLIKHEAMSSVVEAIRP